PSAETPIPMSDWVDVGVYRRPARGEKSPDKDGVAIYLQKQQIRDGAQHVALTTTQLPSRAGIDPLHKLISRLTTQNTIGVQNRTKRRGPTGAAKKALTQSTTPSPTGRERPPTPNRSAHSRRTPH